MTKKKIFLQLSSYEEFDKRREEFAGLKFDRDIVHHMSEIFPKPSNTKEELYSFLPDGRRVLGGSGNTRLSERK